MRSNSSKPKPVFRRLALAFVAFFFLLAAALLTATSLYSQEAEPTATVIVAGLNVRSGPGTEYERVGGVKQGDSLVIIGQIDNCAWLRVRAPGNLEGWVSGSSQYVQLDQTCTAIQSNEAQSVASATASQQVNVTSTPTPASEHNPVELVPYRAIIQDRLLADTGGFTTLGGFFTGQAVLKNPNVTFLVVFLEGFKNDSEISAAMLDWTILTSEDTQYAPISFGMSLSEELPVLLLGELTAGSVHFPEVGSRPLLALAYVVPKPIRSFTLRNSQGTVYDLVISERWLPQEGNFMTRAKLSEDSFANIRINDSAWCLTTFRGCQEGVGEDSAGTTTNLTRSEVMTATMWTPGLIAEFKREQYWLSVLCERLFVRLEEQVFVPDLLDCNHHFAVFEYDDGSIEVGPRNIYDGKISFSANGSWGMVFENIKFLALTLNDNKVDAESERYWGLGEIGVYATKDTPIEYYVTVALDGIGNWSGIIDVTEPILDADKPISQQPQPALEQTE